MNKTINIRIEFERVTEIINLIRDLDHKNRIEWKHFSKEFIQYGKWKTDELITLIETFESKIDFNFLVNNDQIEWDIELITRFSEKPIWNNEAFYINLGEVNIDLIDRFIHKWNWKWLGRFLVRRDIDLELLERYRSNWSYFPTKEWNICFGGGVVDSANEYLEEDSLFDNPHIRWSDKSYQESFKSEIDEYKKYVRNHASEGGYHIDEDAVFKQFRQDVLSDLPF